MFFPKINCQELKLEFFSLKKSELKILKKINYTKKHKDSTSLFNEIFKTASYLKKIGYFTNTIDSIKKKDYKYQVFISLNKKINFAKLKINKELNEILSDYKVANDSVKFPIENLQSNLSKITSFLDNSGKSFSKVKLSNIKIKADTLFGKIIINESFKRTISKVTVKGYENFPTSYLNRFFKLKRDQIFNKSTVEKISSESKNLRFVQEIKPPEILFTKDSTFLYIYLKKINNNSVDALLNFATQEDGSFLLNGNIDLKLNNVLNTGEEFNLYWNSIAKERQEFKISTFIPYLFNSPISPNIEFSIYRQDSSFTNTKFKTLLNYDVNSKLKLAFSYNAETSESLQNTNNEITSFTNQFLGININYNQFNQDIFNNKKLYFNINPSLGERKAENNNSNQFKFELTTEYLWELNQRNFISIKNNTGLLNSDQYFTNELFRIGGVNSIRGFNEQSIFTKNYSYFNFEYRFLASTTSYFYTITDLGFINTTKNESILGLGLGYLFINNQSKINLNIALGKTSNNNFDFNNLKLAISWVNYF